MRDVHVNDAAVIRLAGALLCEQKREECGLAIFVALVDLDPVALSDTAADLAAIAGCLTDELPLALPSRPARDDGARVLPIEARRDDLYGQPPD